MARYALKQIDGSTVITKDGHTMFSEDAVKDLNRLEWLEEKLDTANELLGKIVESGADLNEHFDPVHEYLTK